MTGEFVREGGAGRAAWMTRSAGSGRGAGRAASMTESAGTRVSQPAGGAEGAAAAGGASRQQAGGRGSCAAEVVRRAAFGLSASRARPTAHGLWGSLRTSPSVGVNHCPSIAELIVGDQSLEVSAHVFHRHYYSPARVVVENYPVNVWVFPDDNTVHCADLLKKGDSRSSV